MRSHSKHRRGEDIEEVLASIPTTPEGCKLSGGTWNKKAKQCDLRQLRDKNNPDEIIVKKFDRVERADEIETTKTAEQE